MTTLAPSPKNAIDRSLSMMDKTLDTIDGYAVVIPGADWKFLESFPTIDAVRLVVIDGAPHAMLKGTDTPHRLSIEDLVLLAKPLPAAVAPEPPAPIPAIGPPRGMLATFVATGHTHGRPGGGLPPLWVRGVKTFPQAPMEIDGDVRVPLTDEGCNLLGHVRISAAAYRSLVGNPKTRVDRLQWRLEADGVITTRSRAGAEPVRLDLGALLGMLRLGSTPYVVEMLAP